MGSRVPELIDALVAALRADEALAGVVVTDGPEVTEAAGPDWILVGYSGDAGDFQAAATQGGWASLSTDREETAQLTVTVLARRGDTNVKAARDRVYAVAGRLEELLRVNPAVGLRSAEVAIAGSELMQEQADDGVTARLLLTLGCQAFT